MRLIRLPEPKLLFGHNQAVEDPRDGLTLFGPLDEGKTFGIRPAVVGTKGGVQRFWRWVESIQRAVNDDKPSRPPYPGFEAAFGVPFGAKAVFERFVDEQELTDACNIVDVHQRVHKVVHLYADPIRRTVDEDERADVWFVVVPDIVYERCRPKSVVPEGLKLQLPTRLSPGMAKKLKSERSMFDELNEDVAPYRYEPHFRNQLKAVLLGSNTPTQVVRESTLAPTDFLNQWGYPPRRIGGASEVAWNLSSTAFYKSGARPWKVEDVRPGVCYLGIVFKRDDLAADGRWSSCGAQMFLDSGDGLVFKGTGGPWFVRRRTAITSTGRQRKHLSSVLWFPIARRPAKLRVSCSSTAKRVSTTTNGEGSSVARPRRRTSSACVFGTRKTFGCIGPVRWRC